MSMNAAITTACLGDFHSQICLQDPSTRPLAHPSRDLKVWHHWGRTDVEGYSAEDYPRCSYKGRSTSARSEQRARAGTVP